MCVDCGGGTTDIVVHRQEEREDGSLSLREVVKGSGACVGGSTVDAAFLKLMGELVPVFDEYAAKFPKEVQRVSALVHVCADFFPSSCSAHRLVDTQVLRTLVQKFELAKRSFDGNGEIEVDLPPKLARMWYEYKSANYEDFGANVRALRALLPSARLRFESRADLRFWLQDEDDDDFGTLTLTKDNLIRVFDEVPRLRSLARHDTTAFSGIDTRRR